MRVDTRWKPALMARSTACCTSLLSYLEPWRPRICWTQRSAITRSPCSAASWSAWSAAAPLWAALVHGINVSPAAWGMAALAVNLGARFVAADFLSPEQQRFMAAPVVRRVVLFCMCFMVTHNLVLSTVLTASLIVLVEGLLRPGSRFCLLAPVGGCSKGDAGAGNAAESATGVQGGGSHLLGRIEHAAVAAVAQRMAGPPVRAAPSAPPGRAWWAGAWHAAATDGAAHPSL